MSSIKRRPYRFRPRSKILRLKNARIKKKIAEGVKLSFAETEGAGERFIAMNKEEIRKYLEATFDARGVIHVPPTRTSSEELKRVSEQQNLILAETGLRYLNDPANCGKDAVYELVRPMASGFFLSCARGVYHSNFEAKVKDDPEDKAQLFFLEVVEKVPGVQKVTFCCSLGLTGSETAATGLNGCKSCEKIEHPNNAPFITC